MTVGILQIVLQIHDCRSLKQKRMIVKKILERSKNRFNVAAAEVADNDSHTKATLAFVTVSNDRRTVNSALDKIANFVDQLYLAQIVDERIELLNM